MRLLHNNFELDLLLVMHIQLLEALLLLDKKVQSMVVANCQQHLTLLLKRRIR